MAGYYDKNKDYSKELQRTDLSASERDRLTQERQNKIVIVIAVFFLLKKSYYG